jgi:hypothetical protein
VFRFSYLLLLFLEFCVCSVTILYAVHGYVLFGGLSSMLGGKSALPRDQLGLECVDLLTVGTYKIFSISEQG